MTALAMSCLACVCRQYLRHRLWLAGLAADLGGALLMILAFALAPVSPDFGASYIIQSLESSCISATCKDFEMPSRLTFQVSL